MTIGPEDAFVNGWVEDREVVLLTREPSGALRETRVPAEWVAYFREGELPPDLRRTVARHAGSEAVEPGGWVRFGFREADTRRAICFQKEARNRQTGEVRTNPVASAVPTYEADLDPIRRILTDTGARVQRPRRAYVDLETDSRLPFSRKEEMRVLCWALSDDSRRLACGVLQDWSDAAERQVMQELWGALAPYDQVAAWNGDGFDFPVMFARSKAVGVRGVDPRRWNFVDQMVAYRRMNMHAAESGAEKRSMALQSIAMATLGRGKKEFDPRHTHREWEADGERRAELVRYCIEDTLLLPDIEKKTGYLELFATICEVCRLFGNTLSLNPTRQMDGFLLRLARERGHHFPSRKFFDGTEEEEDQFRGAFVMHPRSVGSRKKDAGWTEAQAAAWRAKEGMRNGILRGAHVGDFASLYPSIIVTWNMSPDTKALIAFNGPVAEGHCRCPTTGTGFRLDTRGFLVEAILELLRLRKYWNELKASYPPGTPEWHDADRRQMAFKVAANSFFGVMGSIYSRYHDRDIAEGITQNGVWLIQQTINAAESRGWRVAYGDTDSIFVVGCSREEFADFIRWCNAELYPQILTRAGCAPGAQMIKLDYEKAFDRLVFTGKKRYAGKYSRYKGKDAVADSRPEVKGLEYKRGDASVLAVKLQMEVVKLLMDGCEDVETFHAVLLRAREHVLRDDIPMSEYMLSKSLSKSLREYAVKMRADGTEGAPPPHVLVARTLASRGQDVSQGTRIEYVVVDASSDDPSKRVVAAEDFDGRFDRHYVWESMVYPATQRLLAAAFPDHGPHWELWGRSRPRKTRGGARPLEGQQALGGVDMSPPSEVRAVPPPPLPRHSTAA
jgi:DNA polymerase, archaea type